MAAPGRRTDPSLEEALFNRGFEFEFFQAVRLLARFRGRKPVGDTAKPRRRLPVWAPGSPWLFPASAVHDIDAFADSRDPPRDRGVSALPERRVFCPSATRSGCWPARPPRTIRSRHFSICSIIASCRCSIALGKSIGHRFCMNGAARDQRPDPFTHSLFDLIGMGTDGLRGRMRVQDESLLLYAGLIAQRPHSASALRGILRDYFSRTG